MGWAWIGQTYYLARFDSNDGGHRLFTMLQIVAAASLTRQARDGLGARSAAEAWMLCGSAGLAMVCLNVLLEVTTSFEHDRERHTFMLPHYAIALLTVAAGAPSQVLTGLQLAGLVTALCAAQVLLSLREVPGETMELPT